MIDVDEDLPPTKQAKTSDAATATQENQTQVVVSDFSLATFGDVIPSGLRMALDVLR